MKRELILSFLMLGPLLRGQAQEFTQQEQTTINDCVTNISAKTYSPAKADKCLAGLNGEHNDFKLLDKLRAADEPKLRYILTYENAIKDLGDFFRDAEAEEFLRPGLLLRLESADCVLCKLDLGPQPDKLLPWLTKYAADRVPLAKKTSLALDSLGKETRDMLLKDGVTTAAWAEKTISGRQDFLTKWAGRKYDELLASRAAPMDELARIDIELGIFPYLDDTQREILQDAFKDDREKEKNAKRAGSAGAAMAAAKYGRLQERLDSLPASGGETSAFLGGTFDNSGAAAGAAPGPKAVAVKGPLPAAREPYTLTDAEAASLSPRMRKALLGTEKAFGELADTPLGRETIAFYAKPGNYLNFSIVDLKKPETRGRYNFSRAAVMINKTYVEAAMRHTGVTPDQLLDENNGAALKKVTRFVAPTFVHEAAGHQQQAAWARDNNVPDHYYLGQETEAFSKSALYVLQKARAELAKGNPDYAGQISEYDVQMAKLLKNEGTEGVRKQILFYKVPSQQGKAAENFASYESLKKELTLRGIAAKADLEKEKLADAGREETERTAVLAMKFNAIYPWYKLAARRSEEELRYFQNYLNGLREPATVSTAIRTNAVAELAGN